MSNSGLAGEIDVLEDFKKFQGKINLGMQAITLATFVSKFAQDLMEKGFILEVSGGYNISFDAKIAEIVGMTAGGEVNNNGIRLGFSLDLFGGLHLAPGVEYSDLKGLQFGGEGLKVEETIGIEIEGLPLVGKLPLPIGAELAVGTPTLNASGGVDKQEFALSIGPSIKLGVWRDEVAEAGGKGGIVIGFKAMSIAGFVEENIAPALRKNWAYLVEQNEVLNGVSVNDVIAGMKRRTTSNFLLDFAREVAVLKGTDVGVLKLDFQSLEFGAGAYPFMGGVAGLTGVSVGPQTVEWRKEDGQFVIDAHFANQLTDEGLKYFIENGRIPAEGYHIGTLNSWETWQFDSSGGVVKGAGGAPVRSRMDWVQAPNSTAPAGSTVDPTDFDLILGNTVRLYTFDRERGIYAASLVNPNSSMNNLAWGSFLADWYRGNTETKPATFVIDPLNGAVLAQSALSDTSVAASSIDVDGQITEIVVTGRRRASGSSDLDLSSGISVTKTVKGANGQSVVSEYHLGSDAAELFQKVLAGIKNDRASATLDDPNDIGSIIHNALKQSYNVNRTYLSTDENGNVVFVSQAEVADRGTVAVKASFSSDGLQFKTVGFFADESSPSGYIEQNLSEQIVLRDSAGRISRRNGHLIDVGDRENYDDVVVQHFTDGPLEGITRIKLDSEHAPLGFVQFDQVGALLASVIHRSAREGWREWLKPLSYCRKLGA